MDFVQGDIFGVGVTHFFPTIEAGEVVGDGEIDVVDAGVGTLFKRSLLIGNQPASKGRTVIPTEVEQGRGRQVAGGQTGFGCRLDGGRIFGRFQNSGRFRRYGRVCLNLCGDLSWRLHWWIGWWRASSEQEEVDGD